MFVQNFKNLCAVVPEKFLTTNLLEKKKSRQIKGMINMRMLILSNTIQQVIPHVCENFKIVGAVVPEKSLSEKSLHTHRQTNIVTEKTKAIYPLHTSGGIINELQCFLF